MIDAHVHFWDPMRGDDILILRREPSLARRSMPSDLRPLMAAAGVDRAIAIQSAPQAAETQHLLSVAAPAPEVAAVVGWVDLRAADADRQIAALATQPKLVGVRAMLHRIDDPDWLVGEATRAGLAALAGAGLSLDVTARAEHIPAIAAVARALPSLTLIVDHGATAPITHADQSAWLDGIERLGRDTRVATKFSGLAEEATAVWSIDQLEPAFRHLLACFGSDRIMWASNWPVIDLRGGYATWMAASRALMDRAGLTQAQRAAIEAGTAARVYLGATA